jgi:hypothetical protein
MLHLCGEIVCGVPSARKNPNVTFSGYIIYRVNAIQRLGCPEMQTQYNCNIGRWKRDVQHLDSVLQHIFVVEICKSYQCCS